MMLVSRCASAGPFKRYSFRRSRAQESVDGSFGSADNWLGFLWRIRWNGFTTLSWALAIIRRTPRHKPRTTSEGSLSRSKICLKPFRLAFYHPLSSHNYFIP
jgi:hypothetical protein